MNREPKIKPCAVCGQDFKQYKSTVKVCSTRCAITYAREKEEKKRAKEWRKEQKERKEKLNPEVRKKDLQKEINKLARMIDDYFDYGCIDCGKQVEGSGNGAHLHNVQGNENIRFNLHNIHKARTYCNYYSSEHKVGYKEGLKTRYGVEYLEMVERLKSEYKYLGLSVEEVKEALKRTRKAIREFNELIKGNDVDGSMAREFFNNYIEIYG